MLSNFSIMLINAYEMYLNFPFTTERERKRSPETKVRSNRAALAFTSTHSDSSHQCFIVGIPHVNSRRVYDNVVLTTAAIARIAGCFPAARSRWSTTKGDFYLRQRLRHFECYRPLSAARNSKFPTYFHVLYIHVIRHIVIHFSNKTEHNFSSCRFKSFEKEKGEA